MCKMSPLAVLSVLVILSKSVLCVQQPSNIFEIVGMFTTTSTDPSIRDTYGIYPREAARLAVEHAREEGLLTRHNYDLKLFEFESRCDQTGAVIAYLEYIRDTG